MWVLLSKLSSLVVFASCSMSLKPKAIAEEMWFPFAGRTSSWRRCALAPTCTAYQAINLIQMLASLPSSGCLVGYCPPFLSSCSGEEIFNITDHDIGFKTVKSTQATSNWLVPPVGQYSVANGRVEGLGTGSWTWPVPWGDLWEEMEVRARWLGYKRST